VIRVTVATTTIAAPRPPTPAKPRADDHTRAARFFWTVLILATAASIGGNVTHAVLKAESGPLVAVAAAVAMVPPIVLLAATHSVGLLVRTRNSGAIYWSALAMTVGLAGCAFALSFDSLWELAVSAGVRREIAWLWPLSIDVSIAQATLALLSLTRRRDVNTAAVSSEAPELPTAAVSAAPVGTGGRGEVSSLNGNRRRIDSPTRPVVQLPSAATDWSDVAQTLVRDGTTTKTVTEVAEALQLWEVGTPPNTIARRLGLHRDTVIKITTAAEDLMSAAKVRA
jgi:hypothetical protein